MVKKFDSDIDIDLADRDQVLAVIRHVPAMMKTTDGIRRHSSGIHVCPVPYDADRDMAAIDYQTAEQRGYFKLDLLNVYVYQWVRDQDHLKYLMREPDWSLLRDADFVSKLIHLSNHYKSLMQMQEPVDSIQRLAMFLALIRPSKKHLIGKRWGEISKTIWDADPDGYAFKKSHSLAYAHLVVVHMNLLLENPRAHADFLNHAFYQSDTAPL
jgi:hypothetical protein